MTDSASGEQPAGPGASVVSADAVVARLGSGRFAVDLAAVAEVGRVPPTTRVPGLPQWVTGVANWRGRILSVLDLRSLLGAEPTPPDGSSRLLVIATDGIAVGLLVDAVEGTTCLGDDVGSFPGRLPEPAAGLVCGQLARDDGPVAVLDATAVLALRDLLPRGRRSA